MEIKDSGERREFDTGAVRDIQEGKGRCDLLPLDVVSKLLDSQVLESIYEYYRSGLTSYLYNTIAYFTKESFGSLSNSILEVSKHFEGGAVKYGEHNWEKGIPTHCYIDSAVRHYLKFRDKWDDEPHDRAFVWNILCCIWTHDNKPELRDYDLARDKE